MSHQQQQQQPGQSVAGSSVGLAQLQRPSAEAPKPLNAIYLPGVFGHDQSSLRLLLQPILRTINFAIIWKGDEDVIITSSDSPTRLIMMKTELKALVRREQFARDVILCTVGAGKNIVRREDEPILTGTRSAGAGAAWGSSAMKRGGAAASASGSTGAAAKGLVGDRGWAAVASGSGRNSPAPAAEPVWGQPTMVAAQPSGPRTTAPVAGIIPNPNAPRQVSTTPAKAAAPTHEATVDDEPVPESWEDEN